MLKPEDIRDMVYELYTPYCYVDWHWRDYIICALSDGVITVYEAIIAFEIDNLDGWNKQRQDAVIDFKAGVVDWDDLKRILES